MNNPIKFILFTTRRSGSTFITRSLHTHPEIAMYGEVFLRRPWPGGFQRFSTVENNYKFIYRFYGIKHAEKISNILPFDTPLDKITKLFLSSFFARNKEYINKNNFFDRNTEKINKNIFNESTAIDKDWVLSNDPKAIGFKLMVHQAKQLPAIVDWIIDNNVKIIILKRNILEKYISVQSVAKRGGIAHSINNVTDIELNVSLSEYEKFFMKTLQQYNFLDRLKENVDSIEIDYNTYFKDKKAVSDRLIRFLGVDESIPIQFSTFKNLNRQKIENMVTNFEDLKSLDYDLTRKYGVTLPSYLE